ncbi:MAG: HEAT repeat domain-containing protein [Gemmatimonadota bacterium]
MTRLLHLLNLRRNEVPRLSLAALIFFLVAVNDGIVKSVSAGVFNFRAGVDRLPEMYTWIAVLFSATMVLLSWLTNRCQRQRLLFGLLGLLAAVLLLNTAALWVEHRQLADLTGTGFYPFLFVSSEIARALAGFQIWMAAAGICYSSRAKVLFPLLAASATLGDVAGGFLVRLLGTVLVSYQVYGLAVINIAVVIALMRPLVRRYYVTSSTDPGEAATLTENLRYVGRSAYLRLLFVLSLGVYALYTAIHYTFNVVARQHYTSEGDITGFFGLFFGLAGIATLATTTLLLRHLLRWLGVGSIYLWVCLIHVAIAAALVAVFGDLLPLPVVAVIFGLNLLNYVLLDSVIAPSYHVLMKLVPARNSDGTRMILEGGFMLLGGLLGAGVTALHAEGILGLDQLFTLLGGLAALMAVAGWRLKASHTEVLVRAVREQSIGLDDEQAMESMRAVLSGSGDYARSLLLHQDDGVRSMGIEIMRQAPEAAAHVCLPLADHENPRIRAAALEALSAAGVGDPVLAQGLAGLDDVDAEVRLAAAGLVARAIAAEEGVLEGAAEGRDGAARLAIIEAVAPRLVPDAASPSLQAELLYVLERLGDAATGAARQLILESLLASEQVDETTAGIETVARLGQVATYPQVLEHLQHAHPAVREAAVRAVAPLGDEETVTALMDLLSDPDPDVVRAAVAGLGRADLERHGSRLLAGLDERPPKEWQGLLTALAQRQEESLAAPLMDTCRRRLMMANRFAAAGTALRRQAPSPATDLLLDQLELERATVQNGVIQLLGQLGDVDVVGDLVERLGEADAGARENAIELLENIGDRSLMALLLPLLTDDEDEQVAAARALAGWAAADAAGALAEVMASRDPWTQMAAAWAAGAMGRPELLAHLPPGARERIETKVAAGATRKGDGDVDGEVQPLTSMEKITFLKESPFFAALPLEELYHVALSVQEETVRPGTTVIKQGSLGDKMYIVVSGQLEVRRFAGEGDAEGHRIAVTAEKQVFGDMALLDDEPRSASVTALTECHLLSLERGDLERILRRYSSIAFSMMRILSRRLRQSMAA